MTAFKELGRYLAEARRKSSVVDELLIVLKDIGRRFTKDFSVGREEMKKEKSQVTHQTS